MAESLSRGDAGNDGNGIASVVASHYNNIKESGKEGRKESRIYHMRSFNNWIKANLIREYLEKIRSARGAGRIAVLDIGCGKGGDLLKYDKGRIGHLVCTDIAETSLSQCRDRYEEMKRRNSRIFSAEFVPADSTRDRLRTKYKDIVQEFDLVSIQFSFHYCFESREQVECMLRNASENLRKGGYFIGTTIDSRDVLRRLGQTEDKISFGNEVYSITLSDELKEKVQVGERIPLFGAQYKFHLVDCVDCPEFLVYFPVLEEMAKKYGFKLVFKERFEDLFENNRDEQEDLLVRMNAMETFPAPPGKELVGDPDQGDYDHAKKFVDSLRTKNPNRRDYKIGTLSKSEWEAATLYLAFAFQKISSYVPPYEPSSSSTAKSPPEAGPSIKKKKSS